MKLLSRHNKIFFLYFFTLALPIAFQHLVSNLLNTLDTLMIGFLNEVSIAGVGLANKVFFLYQLVTFGLFSGSSIFVSQYWGKRDIEGIRTVSFIQICGVLILGVLFFIPSFFFPEFVMGLFSPDTTVIEIGAKFLKVASLTYIPSGISISYYFILRTTQNALPCVYISLFSLFLNGVLNYLLIFGAFGFPRLEVVGAAIATLISRIVELIIVIILIRKRFEMFCIKISNIKQITWEFIKKFFKSVLPVIGNESLWSLGVVLYSVIFAWIGTETVASTSIATSLETLLNVFFFGLGNASGIIVGKKIGQRKEPLAIKYAFKFAVIVPILSILLSILGILISPYILNFYNISEVTRNDTYLVFILICLFLPFKNFNLINIVGSLRNAGDTKFCLLIDIGGVWFIALPLAIISGLVLHMNIGWVYFFILFEEFVKVIVITFRLRTKKWINNLVH